LAFTFHGNGQKNGDQAVDESSEILQTALARDEQTFDRYETEQVIENKH